MTTAVQGADALIAASKPGPHTLTKATLKKMNKDAILFALSNPVPEIWPKEAKAAGMKIIATGRSDFPNQVNNSLIFPAVIRGVLDVRSKSVTDEVIIAGAKEARGVHSKKWHSNGRAYPAHHDGLGDFSDCGFRRGRGLRETRNLQNKIDQKTIT